MVHYMGKYEQNVPRVCGSRFGIESEMLLTSGNFNS